MHEAHMHEENSFITLTYNSENLPADLSLNKKHFVDFMKRLRKTIEPKKIRFYHVGEYGSAPENGDIKRPHYHALIFGYEFPDKKYWKTINGEKLHTSELLSDRWQEQGFVSIGNVTYKSAAYCTRYMIGKQKNSNTFEGEYERVHPSTGEVLTVQPEYSTMSRKPGLGTSFYEKYPDSVFPQDFIIGNNGKKLRTPKFYDTILDKEKPIEFETIRQERMKNAKRFAADNTPERLLVREKCLTAKLKKLPRRLEND